MTWGTIWDGTVGAQLGTEQFGHSLGRNSWGTVWDGTVWAQFVPELLGTVRDGTVGAQLGTEQLGHSLGRNSLSGTVGAQFGHNDYLGHNASYLQNLTAQ